jgi:ubiquinone/menaquinone biosynthesis C-methylase UbiE
MSSTPHRYVTMFGLHQNAHGYDWVARRLAARLYARVAADVASADLPAHARILDVGTGPGLVPLRIAAARPDLRLDAVDLAPEMIEQARGNAAEANAAVTFTVADVARLPFDSDSFDLVLSTLSPHHWTDPTAGLLDVVRVLRPGASAWLYDFRWVLHRTQTAAARVSPAPQITRTSPLAGTWRFNPVGLLVLRKALS